MDKKIKTKWVKALRSGRYKQGEACLKDSDGRYCCLGVLATLQGVEWSEDLQPILNGKIVGHRNGATGYLAAKVASGLRFQTQNLLADMNDGARDGMERQSFKQLADYIEKRL